MMRVSVPTVLLQNFLFCTVIALTLWKFVPSLGQFGFFPNFVHAQAIGNCIALVTLAVTGMANWYGVTSRWVFIFLIVAVTPIGIYVGALIAGWSLGFSTGDYNLLTSPEQLLIAVVTAVIATSAFYWHLSNRAKLLRLELLASEESHRADNARHAMLQAQLEPHMLFNTLANLRVLIGSDPDRAVEMLDRLDSFLRETLSSSQATTNKLKHEFQVLEDYLTLMKIRIGKRLQYQLELPDNCKDLNVPSLLLQPLVENAIKHGIEPEIEGGLITVNAKRAGRHLILSVSDTGAGMSKSAVNKVTSRSRIRALRKSKSSGGFGLENLRDRLEQSFSDEATMRYETSATNSQVNGTRITLSIPLQEQQTAAGQVQTGAIEAVGQVQQQGVR